jgi:hypothetical protein
MLKRRALVATGALAFGLQGLGRDCASGTIATA